MVLRCVYRITAVWLGFVNYAFFSAVACWVSYVALRLIRGAPPERDYFALGFLGLAVAVTAYGVINAAATRVKRITVKLPNLPDVVAWADRGADERSAPGKLSRPAICAAHGENGKSFESRRGFYRRGFV